MSIAVNLFPVLSEELKEKIGFLAGSYQFSYTHEGQQHSLNANPVDELARSNYFQLSDEIGEWGADIHNLQVRNTFTIQNPQFLFGPTGIASAEAELGAAIIWTSKSSNQRGVIEIGGFRRNTAGETELTFSSSFPAGQLKGSITFQIVLYLKEPGRREQNERHLANSAGVLLGDLDETLIILDGNGSVFPIVEVEEKSQPLWWVSCNWTDPMGEKFDEENVRICLNKAHPSFKLLQLEGGLQGSPLLADIIASALQIIIQKARESEYWQEIVSGQNYEHGSIAEAIHYFITTFNWDTYSPENLALSIRRDFDARI